MLVLHIKTTSSVLLTWLDHRLPVLSNLSITKYLRTTEKVHYIREFTVSIDSGVYIEYLCCIQSSLQRGSAVICDPLQSVRLD
jgi:hypothetical protein